MIDILDQLIALTKTVDEFGGRVYRQYPQTSDGDTVRYAIITRGSHTPLLVGDDNGELISSLSYQVDVFGTSPSDCDDIVSGLVELYKPHRIICTGISPGYMSERMYCVTATFSVTLDKRGYPYTG